MSRPGLGFKITTVIAMTTASLLVMWLADQITQHGVGNGTSLIIMINITSRLPVAIIEAWTRYFGLGGITAARSPVELLLLLIFGFLIVMGTVMLTQGVRKVPIHSTRRSAPVGPSLRSDPLCLCRRFCQNRRNCAKSRACCVRADRLGESTAQALKRARGLLRRD